MASLSTSRPPWSLRPIRAHNPNSISIGSAVLHRWPQSVPIRYNGMPLSPSKLPLPKGGSGPPCNTWLLGLTGVLNPNGILIGAAVFAGLTSVTDRQTTLLGRVTIGRIYVRSTAMQPNNNNRHTRQINTTNMHQVLQVINENKTAILHTN